MLERRLSSRPNNIPKGDELTLESGRRKEGVDPLSINSYVNSLTSLYSLLIAYKPRK